MRITNQAPGPRGFNAQEQNGNIIQVLLQPGESHDDPNVTPVPHPAFAGLVRSGDLVLGDAIVERINLTATEMQAKARRNSEQSPASVKALA